MLGAIGRYFPHSRNDEMLNLLAQHILYVCDVSTYTHKCIDHSIIEKLQSTCHIKLWILTKSLPWTISFFLFSLFKTMFSVSSSMNKRKQFMLFSRKNIFRAKPSICIIFSTIYKNPTKHCFRTSVVQHHSLLEKQHSSVNFTIDQSFQPANCDNWIFIDGGKYYTNA